MRTGFWVCPQGLAMSCVASVIALMPVNVVLALSLLPAADAGPPDRESLR
jgi:hypothetical protein